MTPDPDSEEDKPKKGKKVGSLSERILSCSNSRVARRLQSLRSRRSRTKTRTSSRPSEAGKRFSQTRTTKRIRYVSQVSCPAAVVTHR